MTALDILTCMDAFRKLRKNFKMLIMYLVQFQIHYEEHLCLRAKKSLNVVGHNVYIFLSNVLSDDKIIDILQKC